MSTEHADGRPLLAGRHIVMVDLDGVLLDTSVQHALAWQEALAACGYKLSLNDSLLHVLRSGPDVMPPVLSPDDLRAYGEAIRAMYWAIYVRNFWLTVRPMPGAVELVADLKTQGFQVVVVSASHTALIRVFLGRLKLRDLVDTTVTFEDLKSSHPNPYRVALARLGTCAHEAVAIGATLRSLHAARELGLPFIAVGLPLAPYRDWTEAGAISSFAEVADLRAHLPDLLSVNAGDAWPGRSSGRDGLALDNMQHEARPGPQKVNVK